MPCPDPPPRPLLFSCLIAALALCSAPVFAQDSCDLDGAGESYHQGRFGEALEELKPCPKDPGINLADLREVYRLEAKIHIALNDLPSAREAVTQLLKVWPGFERQSDDPLALLDLVDEVRREEGSALVTVVSKTGEGLRQAPAILAVVTAAQIERRGYLDLEEVLHDLPGLDLSRGNGEIYSNVNPRGFRATANDRMLLLVDGVEQNDLSSGTAHLSRQYSLLNVERVEVLYGPASALYGPTNAYSGVINVVTRPPDAFLGPGEHFGGRIVVTSGSLDTRAADFTLAGRLVNPSLALSVSGRLHRSSEHDRQALSEVPASELSFSDDTQDWFLSGKVRTANLVLGFQTWRQREETTSRYTELARAGQGIVWTPKQTAFFLNSSFPLPSKDLVVRFAARYRQSGLDGERELSMERFSQLSTQLTGELSLVYDSPKRGLSAVGGADLKIGSIQAKPGSVLVQTPPNEHTDAGLYAQATYSPPRDRWRGLKLAAAGRLDFNRVDTLTVAKAGYGTVFSPRLAAVYDAGALLFKAIYSRGYREPSDAERFSLPGGRLEPETVDNVELGVGWHTSKGWWTEGLTVEIAGYRSDHRDLIRLQSTGRFRNAGTLRAQGGHLTVSAERKRFRVFGNYTYTDSRDPDPMDDLGGPLVDSQGRPVSELRLTDLARHRANLGFNVNLGSRWNLDLRSNYASARRSPGNAAEAPAYLLAHAAASYRDLLPGMKLQLAVRNLFDDRYEDLGVQLVDQGFAERIPQPGRTLYLRILYQYQGQRYRVRP